MTIHARSARAKRHLYVGAIVAVASLAGAVAFAQNAPQSAAPTFDLRATAVKSAAQGSAPDTPSAASAGEGGKTAAGDLVTLNFVNVDLDAVVGAIGQMTNRTFIVDPRVRGQITLATPNPVPREEAYRMLLSVLRLQGFAVVEDGKFAKVVPESDAKLQNGRVDAGGAGARGDQIVTQVFRLNYESAANLVPILRPLISPNNTISAYDANNTLVVTDYADNLRRIGRIIATIDVPGAVDLEIIPLKYATAIDMATLVTRLLEDGRQQGSPAGQRVIVLADQRTNSLLLRAASRLRAEQAKSLIARLDQPTQGSGNVNIVYLKNAEATKLAQLLRSILTADTSPIQSASSTTSLASSASSSGSSSGSSAGGASLTAGSAASPIVGGSASKDSSGTSAGGMIQADPATNSLIITAPEPVYRNIREIVEKLDMRRAQVFIETLIVEVSADTAAQLGVQWLNLNGLSNSTASAIGGQVFTNQGTSIVSAAQSLTNISEGLNIGVVKGSVTIPGVGTVANLGVLANALQSNTNANVLSAPNIMTLDNEQATTMVGQNVPFVTGSYTTTSSSSSSSTTSPFQTVERKDVGVTLKVKPQISEGGAVRLQIYQEVSSVADKTLSAGIITNKRSIETNVVVDDGQIIVLGGLVEDQISNSVDKVPLLGDIPIIGHLFRSESRSHTKTNLMIFLRPHVVRDTAGSNSVLLDRYDFMRARAQENTIPDHWLLPNMPTPDLPALDQNATVKGSGPLIESAPVLMRQRGAVTQPQPGTAPAAPAAGDAAADTKKTAPPATPATDGQPATPSSGSAGTN